MEYLLSSAGCFSISAVLSYAAVNTILHVTSLWLRIASSLAVGFLIVLTCLVGIAFLFISTQPVSRYFSVPVALFHFIVEYGAVWFCRRAKNNLEDACKRPREIQEELLGEILRKNKETVYFRDFGLTEVKNMQDLKEMHPLTDYDHYVKYVDRIAKGERNIMLAGLPDRLVITSGTTGKGKRFPVKLVNSPANFLLYGIASESFPHWQPMRPKLFFYCLPTMTKSEGGIDVAPVGYIPPKWMNLMVTFTTPKIGLSINTLREAIYVHLLFGMRDKDVGYIMAVFTTAILEAMQLLEKQWIMILQDLSRGSIDLSVNLPSDVRESLTMSLKGGCPERAAELEEEFQKGFDGIMKRIWPNVAFIAASDILNIRDTLQKTYCKGIPIFTHTFGGSEGVYGSNFDPFSNNVEFVTLLTGTCVFEFILEEDMTNKNPKTLFIDQVEKGKNYELVITQDFGLYRYRVGDVIQITGFHFKCPKMKFMYRSGTLLNMCGEKVSSEVVRGAVRYAVLSNYPEVNFLFHTVAESSLIHGMKMEGLSESESENAHYIFFLEIDCRSGLDMQFIDTTVLAKTIDDSLYQRHTFYRNFKDTKQINPSSVYLVHPGTFYKLEDYVISNTSASANQFKMPDKLQTRGAFEVLFKNRVVKVRY